MMKGSRLLCVSSSMIPKSTKLSLCVLKITDSWCPARHQARFLEPGLRPYREIKSVCESKMTGRTLSGSCVFRDAGQPIQSLLFQEHLLRCSSVVSVSLLPSKGLWSCNPRIKTLVLLLAFVLSSFILWYISTIHTGRKKGNLLWRETTTSYLNTWPISAFLLPNLFNKKFGFAEIAEITVLDHVKNTFPCGKASMKNRCINKKIFAYRN